NSARPVSTGKLAAPTFTDNGAAVFVATGVSASDVDSTNYNGGSLEAAITGGSHAGDTLSLANTANISVSGTTVSFDADGAGGNPAVAIGTLSGSGSDLTVALNANADDAAVIALTQAFQYSSTSEDPTATTRTVTFTLVDGGGTANGGQDTTSFTANVAVQDVNDPPQVNAPTSLHGTINVAFALTGISFSDVDSEGGNEVATFTVSSGTLAATSGGGVTVGGTATALTLSGTVADIDAFIAANNLTFTGNANVTLGIAIDDEDHT